MTMFTGSGVGFADAGRSCISQCFILSSAPFFFSFLPQCKYPFCTALQVYTLLLWGGLQIYELDAGAGFPEQFHQQQVLTIKSVLRVFCLTFLKEQ
jgi:hypothetical protein